MWVMPEVTDKMRKTLVKLWQPIGADLETLRERVKTAYRQTLVLFFGKNWRQEYINTDPEQRRQFLRRAHDEILKRAGGCKASVLKYLQTARFVVFFPELEWDMDRRISEEKLWEAAEIAERDTSDKAPLEKLKEAIKTVKDKYRSSRNILVKGSLILEPWDSSIDAETYRRNGLTKIRAWLEKALPTAQQTATSKALEEMLMTVVKALDADAEGEAA